MNTKSFNSLAQIPILRRLGVGICAAILVLAGGFLSVRARQSEEIPGIEYARGQDVSPTFDGWERNADGTISMYFGYYNRNAQEEVDVPIGPENSFDLGNGDQGQPTHFYPGRKWFVFKVIVPKDWPVDKRLVWTLKNRGMTDIAKGWLEAEWEVEGAGIFLNGYRDRVPAYGSAEGLPNITTTGGPSQTITLPAKATLTAMAMVTGPSNADVERGVNPKGIQIRWILYRGSGGVQFDPPASPPVKGKPVTSETVVTFSVPGTYRIRAIGTDGALFSTHDFDITVSAGPLVKTRT